MNLMVRRVTSAAAMWKRAKSTRQNHALRCTSRTQSFRNGSDQRRQWQQQAAKTRRANRAPSPSSPFPKPRCGPCCGSNSGLRRISSVPLSAKSLLRQCVSKNCWQAHGDRPVCLLHHGFSWRATQRFAFDRHGRLNLVPPPDNGSGSNKHLLTTARCGRSA